jgi:hypothetical protein
MGLPNRALEPTAASGLRRLAVPSSLRSSAAAQRERWASASGMSPNDCFPPPLSSALGRSDPTRLQ